MMNRPLILLSAFVGALSLMACSGGGGGGGGGAAGGTAGAGGTSSGGSAGSSSGGTGGAGALGGSAGSTSLGGASGSGGSGGGVPPGCTEIHLSTLIFNAANSTDINVQFQSELATSLGDPSSVDGMTLSILSPDGAVLDETGTFDLGAGVEANYMTCEHCVVVVQDATAATTKKKFYPVSGTMTISASTPPATASTLGMQGSLDQVKLIEVTIDPPTYESIPVVGGDCLYMTSEPLDASP